MRILSGFVTLPIFGCEGLKGFHGSGCTVPSSSSARLPPALHRNGRFSGEDFTSTLLRAQQSSGAVAPTTSPAGNPVSALAEAALGLFGLDKPVRSFKGGESVADAYDEWTDDGVVEHYWGEHVHLGYYDDKERRRGSFLKSFKKAKDDFVDEMLRFAKVSPGSPPKKVLDFGCGIGGTSRLLGKKFGEKTKVKGIAISPKQIERANELAKSQGVAKHVKFECMDALNNSLPSNAFDLVWVCESTEHMKDKKKAINEITRILKPGGKVVVAVWSQRDDSTVPFSTNEKKRLNYLYEQWSHPPFISINKFKDLMMDTGAYSTVETADWAKETLPSWHHQIFLGVVDPLPWMTRPTKWKKLFTDAWCIHRMSEAFGRGLMQYGMLTAEKKKSPVRRLFKL
uniref:Methyltransferase type 11 domain-containing protein n=1 Tax=Chromera velia CCMP2878 TaxID=1169474 RepID=A0A0G4HZN5_9ALVE|mmetsp:Transcript_725/g.1628  ORF Transcript_725/g.1628 Transcript_725/m.1628 type:complete len:398 (-) Transcript_725:630-1823(-)|eukprot:Cvel_9764.t1-p1 / transcript=Cvel_9764.t1 / gene=Cvel_9764 / organism=Chromera_velia_CCMP2878 / gene_product=Probable tocopherol O-methyltransferase,, putative / transcript_product=Probable tocopherol O-methyltransferase,, putative / location=Cvel_scaffold572:12685-18543(+) / protein_length=397 / sequence_SO=supercontig / SO=protein_coding / is_pseudo=false